MWSVHVLKPKTNGDWCRMVIVQDTVSLPARTETVVIDELMYR